MRASMIGRFRIVGLVLLSGVTLGLSPGLRAATSPLPDIFAGDRDAADTVEIGSVRPVERPYQEPGPESAKAAPLTGNPLWSVPLADLSTTRERPVFSASRRPPPRAVVAAPAEQAVAAPRPAEPERLALALIGAVVGDNDAIAVFLDRSSQKIVRLRQGDSHAGWELSSVQGREVTFSKAERSEILMLQRQEAPGAAPAVAGGSGMPAPQPVAGIPDSSFAPFTPRSTPKNGESDGL